MVEIASALASSSCAVTSERRVGLAGIAALAGFAGFVALRGFAGFAALMGFAALTGFAGFAALADFAGFAAFFGAAFLVLALTAADFGAALDVFAAVLRAAIFLAGFFSGSVPCDRFGCHRTADWSHGDDNGGETSP